MRSAIITGATGAIGSALINELISAGVEVLVFTRADSKRTGNIPSHKLVTVKTCALDGLADVKNDTGKTYDAFYHFAWGGTFGDARNDMYLQNLNIKYALDAVGAAARFGCRTFIGAGSQAEYGRVDGKLTPDTPCFPENGYGMAKLCAGQMTRAYAHRLGIEHIWTRILSVYGPKDGAGTMVMSTVEKLRAGQKAQFTKGEQLWDYLYSADAAKAFRLLGERGSDGKTYVIGSGSARPLKDYIIEIARALNAEQLVELGALPYSPGQVMHLCADITELNKDTGWLPDTDFPTGIKQIIG